VKTTTCTIHRGTVRSAQTLDRHRNGIYNRSFRAAEALKAAEARGIVIKERIEFRAATARAERAREMSLVPFAAPYVPVKGSRVFPALKTCTSPRRAASLRVKAETTNPGGMAPAMWMWGTFTAATGRKPWSEAHTLAERAARDATMYGVATVVR